MRVTNAFTQALAGHPQARPPIWCMRQAGRYQRAYQTFRRRHSFETLCRDPELSAKVALASVEDFDFDAAILFSDLLFPLDAIGLGLTYSDDGPQLKRRFSKSTAVRRSLDSIAADLAFQAEAVAATRRQLPTDKGLIGFIGGPWTLFVYAVEGTHRGSLAHAKSSMALYRRFARTIVPVLERAAARQLAAGADLVMVFDTAAGELSPEAFRRHIVPDLTRIASSAPGRLGYFARGVHPAHFDDGQSLPGALGRPWIRLAVVARRCSGQTGAAGLRPRQLRSGAPAPRGPTARVRDRRVPGAARLAGTRGPARLDLRSRPRRAARYAGVERARVREGGSPEALLSRRGSVRQVRRAGAAVHELPDGAAVASHAERGRVAGVGGEGARGARPIDRRLRPHPVLRIALHVLRLQHGDHAGPRPRRRVRRSRAGGARPVSPRRARSVRHARAATSPGWRHANVSLRRRARHAGGRTSRAPALAEAMSSKARSRWIRA